MFYLNGFTFVLNFGAAHPPIVPSGYFSFTAIQTWPTFKNLTAFLCVRHTLQHPSSTVHKGTNSEDVTLQKSEKQRFFKCQRPNTILCLTLGVFLKVEAGRSLIDKGVKGSREKAGGLW